jgi:hypothetical protein
MTIGSGVPCGGMSVTVLVGSGVSVVVGEGAKVWVATDVAVACLGSGEVSLGSLTTCEPVLQDADTRAKRSPVRCSLARYKLLACS